MGPLYMRMIIIMKIYGFIILINEVRMPYL